jgi:hypothetical protein
MPAAIPIPSGSGAVLTGVVSHAGRPLPGARVELRPTGWVATGAAAVASTQAGSDGAFRFDDIPAGEYSVVGIFSDGEADSGGWPAISVIPAHVTPSTVFVPLERKVRLVSPALGAAAPADPALRWATLDGVALYHVLVIDRGATSQAFQGDTPATAMQVWPALAPGTYTWLVSGTDADGNLIAGGEGEFTVPSGAGPQTMPRLLDHDRAFAAARAELAARLGIDELAIIRIDVTPQRWPDSCLGLPKEGEMCAQVITPGWGVEQVAQIRARLGLGRIGPEEEGQPLAGDGGVGMHEKECQQAVQAPAVQAGDGLTVIADVKLAQEPDLKSGHGRPPYGRRALVVSPERRAAGSGQGSCWLAAAPWCCRRTSPTSCAMEHPHN